MTRHSKTKIFLPIYIIFTVVLSISVPQKSVAESALISRNEDTVSFRWEGVSWDIPKKFFLGFRPYSGKGKDMWIQFGYMKSSSNFVRTNEGGYDLRIDVHIRRLNTEDPKNALAMIRRVGVPFAKLPLFDAANFNGMTYVGSSALGPYFHMLEGDAYVGCHEVIHDKLLFPQVSPYALNEAYVCGTTFALPSGLYAWVVVDGAHLNDVAKAFVTTHNTVLSFIHR